MDVKRIPSINYGIIGRYRTQLMGIAMQNVMMLHSMSWLSIGIQAF